MRFLVASIAALGSEILHPMLFSQPPYGNAGLGKIREFGQAVNDHRSPEVWMAGKTKKMRLAIVKPAAMPATVSAPPLPL